MYWLNLLILTHWHRSADFTVTMETQRVRWRILLKGATQKARCREVLSGMTFDGGLMIFAECSLSTEYKYLKCPTRGNTASAKQSLNMPGPRLLVFFCLACWDLLYMSTMYTHLTNPLWTVSCLKGCVSPNRYKLKVYDRVHSMTGKHEFKKNCIRIKIISIIKS